MIDKKTATHRSKRAAVKRATKSLKQIGRQNPPTKYPLLLHINGQRDAADVFRVNRLLRFQVTRGFRVLERQLRFRH